MRLAELQHADAVSAVDQAAGLQVWPKLFHALCSSCETDLARKEPLYIVTAIIGNTPKIAMKPYLMVTDEDFDRIRDEPTQGPTHSAASAASSKNLSKLTKRLNMEFLLHRADSKRRARDSNPQPVARHHISSKWTADPQLPDAATTSDFGHPAWFLARWVSPARAVRSRAKLSRRARKSRRRLAATFKRARSLHPRANSYRARQIAPARRA